MNQAAAQTHEEFETSKDYHLVAYVYAAAKANPGLVADKRSENFIVDQRDFMEKKLEARQGYWRLSKLQKIWLMDIALNQLNLNIPEEYE